MCNTTTPNDGHVFLVKVDFPSDLDREATVRDPQTHIPIKKLVKRQICSILHKSSSKGCKISYMRSKNIDENHFFVIKGVQQYYR
jgi:hypothetical protein